MRWTCRPGGSIFEAAEGGLPVDAVVYNVRTGQVVIGRAMTHQSLINRFAPEMSLDDRVRGDLFARRFRVEFDTYWAAVDVDGRGLAIDVVRAWEHILDALAAFEQIGLPGAWRAKVDGEELMR